MLVCCSEDGFLHTWIEVIYEESFGYLSKIVDKGIFKDPLFGLRFRKKVQKRMKVATIVTRVF